MTLYAAASSYNRADCRKMWRHPQDRKYVTYYNAAMQKDVASATGNSIENLAVVSEICVCTNRQTYSPKCLVPLPERIRKLFAHGSG